MSMSKKKILAYILLPVCFVWLVYTGMLFWEGVVEWRDPAAKSTLIFYKLFYFICRNIPTVIVLNFCRLTFSS